MPRAATLCRVAAIAAAKSWVGTPYVLKGRIKGAGVDCGMLLAEYLIEIGAVDREELADEGPYAGDWFCHTTEERYLRALMKYGTAIASGIPRPLAEVLLPGNLVLFRLVPNRPFNHGCIVTKWPLGIHADCEGVRESNMAAHRLTCMRPMEVFDPFRMPGGE